MRIVESEGIIVFEILNSVDRPLGSDEKLTVANPAAKAVACNAQGVFKNKGIMEINKTAIDFGRNISKVLTT